MWHPYAQANIRSVRYIDKRGYVKCKLRGGMRALYGSGRAIHGLRGSVLCPEPVQGGGRPFPANGTNVCSVGGAGVPLRRGEGEVVLVGEVEQSGFLEIGLGPADPVALHLKQYGMTLSEVIGRSHHFLIFAVERATASGPDL